VSTITRHLGPQFAPAFDRPFLRYFEGDAGAPGGAPAATPSEPATPAAAPAAPAPTPTPAAPAAPAAPATPAAPAATPAPVQYQGNPDEYVRELRQESRGHREALEKEQGEHTTTKAERDTATARVTSLERENFLLRNAGKYGANPDLLLDSSSFMQAFADVDVAKEEDVKKAIDDAIKRNAAFKAGPTLPGASGFGHQGGQATPTNTPSLTSAVAARLGG